MKSIMQSHTASRLDRFLTCFAGLAIVSAVIAVASGPIARARAAALANYQVGDEFAPVAGLDFSQSPATTVAFISTKCGPCQESGDTFRLLTSMPRNFQVAVVGYEEVEALRGFVEKFAIRADLVSNVPTGSIRFSGVPKIAVLDRRGVIRSIWSGSDQIQASLPDILASLQGLERDDATRRDLGLRGRRR